MQEPIKPFGQGNINIIKQKQNVSSKLQRNENSI